MARCAWPWLFLVNMSRLRSPTIACRTRLSLAHCGRGVDDHVHDGIWVREKHDMRALDLRGFRLGPFGEESLGVGIDRPIALGDDVPRRNGLPSRARVGLIERRA